MRTKCSPNNQQPLWDATHFLLRVAFHTGCKYDTTAYHVARQLHMTLSMIMCVYSFASLIITDMIRALLIMCQKLDNLHC